MTGEATQRLRFAAASGSRRRTPLAAALALAVLLAAWLPGAQASPTASTGSAGAGVGQSGGIGEPSSNLPGSVQPSFPVGLRVVRLLDRTRTIRLRGGRTEPRTLLTYVRYPALGPAGASDIPNAPPATASGPYPLIVFAHGFAVTPAPYTRLLQSWARAGYVVAAPVFPLASADAPGGPNEADVVNQPSDVSFVISSLLALGGTPPPTPTLPATPTPGGTATPGAAPPLAATPIPGANPLSGLVSPGHVAVAGHSDGGETALAVAYSHRFRDPRVGAAVVLSGAEMSGVGGYSFAPGAPPLLAAQGTRDTFNEPRYTYAYFRRAGHPKFLLRLLGGGHLAPYTYEEPQLTIVERETLAFFEVYLHDAHTALQRMISLGSVPHAAALLAEP